LPGARYLSRVSFAGSCFFLFGAAGLGLGGMLGLAFGLYVHHARRARVPRFALDPGIPFEEGPALLGGTVQSTEDEDPGAVLAVEVPAPPARGQRRHGRPFTLVLPFGREIGVVPEEGRWSLDTTFVPALRQEQPTYQASVHPGDVVYVRGSLRREVDPRAAGKSYRDVARRWVLRGDLDFSSAAMIAAHGRRAAFHGGWAQALAALFATVHLGLWSAAQPSSSLGSGSGLLALLLVVGVGVRYWLRSEETALWLPRKVRVG
jgi:hypothetical protein